MTTEENPPFIARQLALGFGSVAVVSILMCAMLVAVIHDVAGTVDEMRHDETSIREGRQLATSVRELSIHVAHTIIDGDGSHVDHYGEWQSRVASHIERLAPSVPAAEQGRLDSLRAATTAIDELLRASALPAARAGNTTEVRRIHHELEALGEAAAEDADVIAQSVASHMAHAHDRATDTTQLGLLGGGLCVLLVLALAIGFTARLRASVLKPLIVLTDGARRVGGGDFKTRVGNVGPGELGTVGVAFDTMADELLARESRLVRQERMAAIGQLAAGVAHELNNPIGIIRGYLKTMVPDGDVEVLGEELAILDEEAAQCQRIAHDLLSYARAGELDIEPVDMVELLNSAKARFSEMPAGENRSVEVEADECTLGLDSGRFGQVLLNLLSNAAEASPPEAPIFLVGTTSPGSYSVEVRDAGIGIEKSARERIFEPFFSKRRGGTGLGLAVCLGIVRAHDGTIQVADTLSGVGTVIQVILPTKPGQDLQSSAHRSSA